MSRFTEKSRVGALGVLLLFLSGMGVGALAQASEPVSVTALGPLGEAVWGLSEKGEFLASGVSSATDSRPPFWVAYVEGARLHAARLLSLPVRSESVDAHRHIQELEITRAGPVALAKFTEPDLPLEVLMDVYSPSVPQDSALSGLPLALFNLRLRNTSDENIRAKILLNWPVSGAVDGATWTVERRASSSLCVISASSTIPSESAVDGMVLGASGPLAIEFGSLPEEDTQAVLWSGFARSGNVRSSSEGKDSTSHWVSLSGELDPREEVQTTVLAGWSNPDSGDVRLSDLGWFGLDRARQIWRDVLEPSVLISRSSLPPSLIGRLMSDQAPVRTATSAFPVRQLGHVLHSDIEREALSRYGDSFKSKPAQKRLGVRDLVRRGLWVLQTAAYVMESDDRAFALRMWEGVRDVAADFQDSDMEADSLPEGGSAFSSRPAATFASADTAVLTVAVLEAAAELAHRIDDLVHEDVYREKAAAARASLLHNLWTGSEFLSGYRSRTSETDKASLATALLGDWCADQAGFEVIPGDVSTVAMESILERNSCDGCPDVSLAVSVDGTAVSASAPLAIRQMSLPLEMIRLGLVDEGLALLQSMPPTIGPDEGAPVDAAWQVLSALSGASLDTAEETVILHPVVPSGDEELSIPLFFSSAWFWLKYSPENEVFSLRVEKSFQAIPRTIRYLKLGLTGERIPIPPFRLQEGTYVDLWPAMTKAKQTESAAE